MLNAITLARGCRKPCGSSLSSRIGQGLKLLKCEETYPWVEVCVQCIPRQAEGIICYILRVCKEVL